MHVTDNPIEYILQVRVWHKAGQSSGFNDQKHHTTSGLNYKAVSHLRLNSSIKVMLLCVRGLRVYAGPSSHWEDVKLYQRKPWLLYVFWDFQT